MKKLLILFTIPVIVLLISTPTHSSAATVIAHRGARVSGVPENTLVAFRYAAPYASIFETDVRWTRDPTGTPDRTMILMHDSTVDRTTNCTGKVSDLYWTYILDHCHTGISEQQIPALSELLDYAALLNKSMILEIKDQDITDHQANQFWDMVKTSGLRAQVTAFSGGALRSLMKVKQLDIADTRYNLMYGLEATYPPTPAEVKMVGYNLHVKNSNTTATQVKNIISYGIRVNLWIGTNETDYASMLSKKPTGVIVDDAKRYKAWVAAQTPKPVVTTLLFNFYAGRIPLP